MKEKRAYSDRKEYLKNKIKEEVQKCVLLCANCHAEVHAGITKVP